MASPEPQEPTPPGAFDRMAGTLDYAMFIVTARRGEERAGCLVGFATQVSIRPSRFLACLSDKNRTYRVACDGDRLAARFLPAHEDPLAQLFGGRTGDEVDKFAACGWHDGPHALPILDACENWFVGRVVDRVPFGDHVGFVLAPEEVHFGTEGRPFMFHRARRIDAGHEA